MRSHLNSVAPHSTRSAARRMTALVAVAGLTLAGLTSLVASPANASEYGAPDVTFNTNAANVDLGSVRYIVPLRDGGVLVRTAGDEEDEEVGSEAMRKLDASGNEVMSYAIDMAGDLVDDFGVQVGDDGVVVAGEDDGKPGGIGSLSAGKFDAQGQAVAAFRTNYDNSLPLMRVECLIGTGDGGFVVGGFRQDGGYYPRFVKKFDANGSEDVSFWKNGEDKTNSMEHCAATPDGSLVFMGNDGPPPRKFDAANGEVDSFANNADAALGEGFAMALDVLPNGTLVVVWSNSDETQFSLKGFDSAGNELTSWDFQWTATDYDPILAHTSGSHLLLSQNGTLREFDANGNEVESPVSSIPASLDGPITAMEVTADDTLVIVAAGHLKKYSVQEAAAPTVSAVSPATGLIAGGTSITITGTNFAAGASLGVTVGGFAATSVRVVSATKITAKTPAHAAGVANIVVTNGDGQTATLSGVFTFTVPADPPPVTVLTGAAAKNAKVVTVTSKVSGDFRAAPSINVVVAVGVIPSVKGLPKSSSIKVEVSATFQNRPTTNYQTIGTLRSDANGNLKVTAFKASRAGSLNIRFKTSAGKNYYLKVQVTAR
ncbi:MAG: IPT/TIG domain-containing protein [Actinobacteria bacterium]|nr:IPT/TIG domain-containing protein [Actinomycetota bacterium]